MDTNLILVLVVFFGVMYFFMIRPQNKQVNERRTMINSVREDDEIVTVGGLHGVVVGIDEEKETLILNVAPDVDLEFLRNAVQTIQNRDWKEEFPQFQKKGLFQRK